MRWARAGVQVRSTVAATAVLAIVVGVASAALVLLLSRELISSVDATGEAEAAGIAAQVRLDASGRLAANSGSLTLAITASAARRSWVQVLDADGQVIAHSNDLTVDTPLVTARPAAGDVQHLDQHLPFDEDPYRIIARGGVYNGHRFTVLVGHSVGQIQDTRTAVVTLLGIGGPLLLIALGVATYIFVGRSLRPVEAIRRTVAGMRDLSERVEVPPVDDEVGRLAVTMNAMLERMESAQRAQRQFVADASHELRSPIATLAASAEVFLAHPDTSDPETFPTGVMEEAKRLERLVNDLLLLARADERGMRPGADDVDLDDIIDAERHRVLGMSALEVAVRISPVRVTGDRHQLEQVVRNLVDNAVKHARERVEFTVRQEGSQAVLEIVDDGPGIAADDRQRIFDRFVRLEESRARATGGTGLGLAIVQEIVSAHRGDVRVVDREDGGDGARFQLVLPVR